MRVRRDAIDAGGANEVAQQPGIRAADVSCLLASAVAAKHVPRRVADDRIEAGIDGRGEDLGKRDRPVQKAPRGRDVCRALEEWRGRGCRKMAAFMEQLADELVEDAAIE